MSEAEGSAPSPIGREKGILRMTPERALELVCEIEELIELGGRADPPTLHRIEEIAHSLEGTDDPTGIIAYKLEQLRSWAQILFSNREHIKWGRGADEIKNILRAHCIFLRKGVQAAIERAKRPQSTSGSTKGATDQA